MRPPAAFSNGELEGLRPSTMQGGAGGSAGPPPRAWCTYTISCIVFPDWRVIRMVGPSVFPEKQVVPKWLVLQYFQKSRLYQNGWSCSISRKAGYTEMFGPSVFPEKQVLKCLVLQYFQIHRSSKWLVLQYFQIHGSKNQVLKPKPTFQDWFQVRSVF